MQQQKEPTMAGAAIQLEYWANPRPLALATIKLTGFPNVGSEKFREKHRIRTDFGHLSAVVDDRS